MRVIEFAPKMDWDAVADPASRPEGTTPPKASKEKKVKKPKKQSKQRLKGGR